MEAFARATTLGTLCRVLSLDNIDIGYGLGLS